MTIFRAEGLKKSFADRLLFSDVSFQINQGDKIGLIGVNGAGKTTLFRILTGQESCDEGTLVRGKDLTVAYMEQYSALDCGKSAYDEVLLLFEEVIQLEEQLDEINRQLENKAEERLLNRQQALYERYERLGGNTFRSRARSALLGLGLSETEISLPVSSLSGGQRTRVLLAKILLSGAELLLLDEPTNHLDLQATEWLEGFLSEYRGTVVLISHDRFFLDRVCSRTFELENRKLRLYEGNYTFCREQREFRRKTEEKEYEMRQKEIRRIEGIIEKQKQFGQERNYVTIRSKQKQIDRIAADMVRPERAPEEIRFSFPVAPFSGNDVLTLRGVSKSFAEKPLFADVDFLLRKQERCFLIGPNGCGKTTLLRILQGEIPPDRGAVRPGAGVQMGYYDQNIRMSDDKKTIFQEISDAYPKLTNTQIRSALAAFLFQGDDVFKTLGVLSGGERARVALTKLMLSGANLFLLDEPTNHLDIPSREALEEALLAYDGSILAVSHDRYFINRLANRVAELHPDGLRSFPGNYDAYAEAKARLRPPTPQPQKPAAAPRENAYLKKKSEEAFRRKQKTRFAKLEERIASEEDSLRDLQALLEQPEVSGDYNRLLELTRQIDTAQKSLADLYAEWEELMTVLE